MSFKFLPDIAIADIAFEVTAPTLNKLFEESAAAASDIMVNPKTVKLGMKKTIKLSADSLENLMLASRNIRWRKAARSRRIIEPQHQVGVASMEHGSADTFLLDLAGGLPDAGGVGEDDR